MISRHEGHVVIFDQSQSSLRHFWQKSGNRHLPDCEDCLKRADVTSRKSMYLSCMPISIGTFPGLHGLCFGFCFAGPLPQHSLSHGPLLRVHFGESLVIRLYSEIDQIHLSSEAQCVSHHLPQVDCHSLYINIFALI